MIEARTKTDAETASNPKFIVTFSQHGELLPRVTVGHSTFFLSIVLDLLSSIEETIEIKRL